VKFNLEEFAPGKVLLIVIQKGDYTFILKDKIKAFFFKKQKI